MQRSQDPALQDAPAQLRSCTQHTSSTNAGSIDSRMRGGAEDGRDEVIEVPVVPAGPQRISTSCLRLGGVNERSNFQSHIESHNRHHVVYQRGVVYKKHHVLDELEKQGLLVGHYAVPVPRPGRTRALFDLQAHAVLAEEDPETSERQSGEGGEGLGTESESEKASESDEDDDDYGSPTPDTSGASTSRGTVSGSSSAQGSRKKGRRKKERVANRTRSRQPGAPLCLLSVIHAPARCHQRRTCALYDTQLSVYALSR